MRIYLVNVGANASHGRLFSPLFDDCTFEFLPIPEGGPDPDKSRRPVRYRDLRSYNKPDEDLLCFVPEGMKDKVCHNDPDLKEFTYGDNPGRGRSGALTDLRKGDVLLFLARLERCISGRRTGEAGFYLVGGLWVDHADVVTPRSKERKRFADNAHTRRGDPQFFGVAGSDRSRRFGHAVPITKVICKRVFRDKNGNPWDWGKGKTDLATIGSYTRSIRCVLDISKPEEAKRAAALRRWIAKYAGEKDAEILNPPELYSYIVAGDSGFAPNPFHGICTLACCKPNIRRTAQPGDYVLGLSPKDRGNRVVYAMRVMEALEFDDYWHDKRFLVKRPDKGAGGVKALGDNIYHWSRGKWQQAPSQHDSGDIPRDTNGKRALTSSDFIYWGGEGDPLPRKLKSLIPGRGHRRPANRRFVSPFIKWFEGHEKRGRLHMPTRELPRASRTANRRKRC